METDLARILNLTDEDLLHFDAEYLSEELQELTEEYKKFYRMNSRRLKLQSEYAKLNYEIYESYMSTHQNAIAISGMYSELRIGGRSLEVEFKGEIEQILDSYLMLFQLDSEPDDSPL